MLDANSVSELAKHGHRFIARLEQTLAFRHVLAERLGTILLSAVVAHTAWHWMAERWERLAKFPFPALDGP